jgi:hypothetical protein
VSDLPSRCDRYAQRPGRRALRACTRAAAGASEEQLGAALVLLVDGTGMSPARAGRALGLPAESVLRLLREQRSEHEHARSRCPGWPLVRGGLGLTAQERAAGDAHEQWCADCRARTAQRDRTRRRLAAAGSVSSVTATGTAALVGSTSAVAAKTVLAIAVGTAAVGGGTAVAIQSRHAPAGHQQQPAGGITSTTPRATSAATHAVPATPTPPAASAPPSTRPSTRPSAASSALLPTRLLPSKLPTPQVPTLLPTLPVPLPTLPVPLPTLPLG